MIYSKSGGYMGIGFAIPINSVKELMIELKDKKYIHKGYIGVALFPLNDEIADELYWNKNYGIVVSNIQPDGPAAQAGIEPGDIIHEANGKKISSADDLIEIVEATEPGKRVKIEVWRNRRNLVFYIETIRRPQNLQ
jgi:serine protease Do